MSSSNVKWYAAAFDKAGKRISSSVCSYNPANTTNADKIQSLKDDVISALKKSEIVPAIVEIINADDYDLYAQKNYIRDMATGKPIPYIPPEPTEEEKKTAEAQTTIAEYKPQFNDMKDAMVVALLNNDTDLQEDLKTEYQNLQAEYQNKIGAIA